MSSMIRRVRLGASFVVLVLASCSSDSARITTSDTLARWVEAFPAIASLAADARDSIVEVSENASSQDLVVSPKGHAPASATNSRFAQPLSRQTGFEAMIPRDARAPFTIRSNGRSIVRVRRLGGQGSTARIEAGILAYDGAWPGVDEVVFAKKSGVEELLVSRLPETQIGYQLELSDGLKLQPANAAHGTVEVVDAMGIPRARFVAAKAWDSARREIALSLRVEEQRILIRVADGAIYPVAIDPEWQGTGSMMAARSGFTATALPTGKILVAGGLGPAGYPDPEPTLGEPPLGDLFDPQNGTFSSAATFVVPRRYHTATRLWSGQILLVGGHFSENASTDLSSELFDSKTGTSTRDAQTLTPRERHTATALLSGNVLIAGGLTGPADFFSTAGPATDSCEIYDSIKHIFRATGSMQSKRDGHSAVGLRDGRVMISGGFDPQGNHLGTAEIYDASTERFTAVGPMRYPRAFHSMTVLPSGSVLVSGAAPLEIFDPQTSTFSVVNASDAAFGSMNAPLESTATLTPSGSVLLCGGYSSYSSQIPLAACESFDPLSNSLMPAPSMTRARWGHVATLLPSGNVAILGGSNDATSEILEGQVRAMSAIGSLTAPRLGLTATTLPTGVVLVVGGQLALNSPATSLAEIYDPATNIATSVASLSVPRALHTATAISSGRVAIIGGVHASPSNSIDEYDPTTSRFANTALLNTPRSQHAAALISSDRILVVGGYDVSGNALGTSEIYDSRARTVALATPMLAPRAQFTATKLLDGSVLVVGGLSAGSQVLADAEIYGSNATVFTNVGRMSVPRYNHTATLLESGRVLIFGGVNEQGVVGTAEVYDPSSATFTPVGAPLSARWGHVAVRLQTGEVLIAGGYNGSHQLVSAELFDEGTSAFTATGPLAMNRMLFDATLTADGKVLVAGGNPTSALEIYDPKSHLFSSPPVPLAPREQDSRWLLRDGRILFAGGVVPPQLGQKPEALNSTELYDPELGIAEPSGPLVTARAGHLSVMLNGGDLMMIGGVTDKGGVRTILQSTEIYSVEKRSFQLGASMSVPRVDASAVLLPSGDTLVTGGFGAIDGSNTVSNALRSAELYDAKRRVFRALPNLNTARAQHASVLLGDGRVLIAGGSDAEIFDPATESFAAAGDGLGGSLGIALGSSEVLLSGLGTVYRFDVATRRSTTFNVAFSPTYTSYTVGGLIRACGTVDCGYMDPATELFGPLFEANGTDNVSIGTRSGDSVLVSVNLNKRTGIENWHEIPSKAVRPRIDSSPSVIQMGSSFELSGSRFATPSAVGSESAPQSADVFPTVRFLPANGGIPVTGAVATWTDTSITATLPPTVYLGAGWLHVVVQGVPSLGAFVTVIGSLQGTACTYSGECTSGACYDGVCCDRRCDGSCEACSANLQDASKQEEGTCLPAASHTNPRGRCIDQLAATCGQNGSCNGRDLDCAHYEDGTSCTSGGVCQSGACLVPAGPHCDDTAESVIFSAADRRSCAPFRCRDGQCVGRCASNLDCQAPYHCALDGSCQPTGNGDTGAASGCGIVRDGRHATRNLIIGTGAILFIFGRRRRSRSRRAA